MHEGWHAYNRFLCASDTSSETDICCRLCGLLLQRLELGALLQVVSAAGAVDHSQLVQLAEKAFSGLPSSGPSSQELVTKASHLTPDWRRKHCLALFHALSLL